MKGYNIGIDIGGVLIQRGSDKEDTSFFGKNYLRTPAVPGALEAVSEFCNRGFDVHLVSKCGKHTEEKTLHWLLQNRVYEQTGLLPGNVHFCRERKDKASICGRLGITHFVDDRLEVLSYLTTVPSLYLFNSQPAEVAKFSSALGLVKKTDDWSEIVWDVVGNVDSFDQTGKHIFCP